MHSSLPTFVLGFHGCDESVADAVLSGKVRDLSPSVNPYDWLGSGVYFWENGFARAMEYAQLRMQHPTKKDRIIRKPAVIGAIIDLGYCLDLLDSRYFGMIREGHRLLEDFFAQLSVPMPVNRSRSGETELILRHLDCAVINMMHRTRAKKNEPPFDTVRAAFIEGEPLFQGSSFNDKNHIQICVCNLRCVRGYFRPRPDDESVNAVPPQPMS